MKRVVIASAVRSPMGICCGQLKNIKIEAVTAAVLNMAVSTAQIDPSMVEDVIFGQSCYSGYADSTKAALQAAEWPEIVPTITLDRYGCSGLDSIFWGAMKVQTGNADIVVAGGLECLNHKLANDVYNIKSEGCAASYTPMLGPVEWAARQSGITRSQVDEWSLRSHQRALAASDSGRLVDEIAPVESSEGLIISCDTAPRRDVDLEVLSAFDSYVKEGICTRGNSAQDNDGAAAVVLMSEEKAKKLGIVPLAYFRSCAVAAAPHNPVTIAVAKALKKANLSIGDIDLIEIQELFAAQTLLDASAMNISSDALDKKVNVNGSGIALGNPIAATGAMRMVSLLHEMNRQGVNYGMETLCGHGGQAICAILDGYSI